MYFGLRVHSPCSAHPAHCSGSPSSSRGLSWHEAAQFSCMNSGFFVHSPLLAQLRQSACRSPADSTTTNRTPTFINNDHSDCAQAILVLCDAFGIGILDIEYWYKTLGNISQH